MNLVKREDAAESILTMTMAAVVSFLGVRFYLSVMNYPQIGRGVWHISHAMTGGLIMTLGMLIMLTLQGKRAKRTAIQVFGFGLGWFIDESGKYLTRDYNYFFRPTVMMVYIFFICLFLLYKFLQRGRVNSKAGRTNKWLRKLITRKQITGGLWIYSVYFSLDKIVDLGRILASPQKLITLQKFNSDYSILGRTDMYMVVFKTVFDVIAAILFLLGARYFWSKKRLVGLRYFKYGLYISILLVTVFKFYFEQFGAILDLLVGVILLEILNEYRREIVAK